jgi:hypothetical protein
MGRCILVAHIVTTDGNPSLELAALGQVGELAHLLNIVVVSRSDLERDGVDKGEGVEQMGEAFGIELLGRLGVAFASADVPRLIVSDRSSACAATSLCA